MRYCCLLGMLFVAGCEVSTPTIRQDDVRISVDDYVQPQIKWQGYHTIIWLHCERNRAGGVSMYSTEGSVQVTENDLTEMVMRAKGKKLMPIGIFLRQERSTHITLGEIGDVIGRIRSCSVKAGVGEKCDIVIYLYLSKGEKEESRETSR